MPCQHQRFKFLKHDSPNSCILRRNNEWYFKISLLKGCILPLSGGGGAVSKDVSGRITLIRRHLAPKLAFSVDLRTLASMDECEVLSGEADISIPSSCLSSKNA